MPAFHLVRFIHPAVLALPLLLACAPAASPPPNTASPRSATGLLSPAPSPEDPAVVDTPLDGATRAQVIDTALQRIASHYVDLDVAAKLEAAIRAHQKHGDYDRVTSSVAFAKLFSAHLQETAHDVHLGIRYKPSVVPPDPPPDAKPDPAAASAADAAERERNRFDNGGFTRVERRPGNIGYVKFDSFSAAWQVGDTVAAAMSLIADTDALILDLRDNIGGYPEMVALVASYVFDGEPVQLSSIYWRNSGTTTGATVQSYTSSYVPGRRYGKEKPVYVLASRETVSAAEAFAYDLQSLKRATIVGETTMGGANPGNVFRVGDHFRMQVAQGRAINPVTKTNWEGTGVKPDVSVSADLALATAEVMALEGRGGKARDAARNEEVASATRRARAELEALKRSKGKGREAPR
jgi:hypothetical protein